MVEPPEGCRLLEPGERIREGDMFHSSRSGRWTMCGSSIGEEATAEFVVARPEYSPQTESGDTW